MRFTIWLLYLVEFANWDSQTAIGHGLCYRQPVHSGNKISAENANAGKTDEMPYHTGTMAEDRTDPSKEAQYRYIEGLWGNTFEWIDGCYNDASGLNIILDPASFSDSAGGSPVGIPASGSPSAFTVSEGGGFPMFYPTESDGSPYVCSCDAWGFDTTAPYIFGGGKAFACDRTALEQLTLISVNAFGPSCGLFYISAKNETEDSESEGLACRPMKLP